MYCPCSEQSYKTLIQWSLYQFCLFQCKDMWKWSSVTSLLIPILNHWRCSWVTPGPHYRQIKVALFRKFGQSKSDCSVSQKWRICLQCRSLHSIWPRDWEVQALCTGTWNPRTSWSRTMAMCSSPTSTCLSTLLPTCRQASHHHLTN